MKVSWDDYSQYMENNPNVPNHQPEYVYLYMCIYGPYNPRHIYIYIFQETHIYIYNPRNIYIYIYLGWCFFNFTIQFWGLEKWIHQLLGVLISSSPTPQRGSIFGSERAPVQLQFPPFERGLETWNSLHVFEVCTTETWGMAIFVDQTGWKPLFKPWWKPLTFSLVNPCRFKNHLLCQLNSFVDETLYIYILFKSYYIILN